MRPTFSIIIPTRNRPGQLSLTVQELFNQFGDTDCTEVIVINDGGCPLPALPPQVKELYCDSLGPSAARNHGAAEAKGDFLIFLDDDCVPRENWFLEMSNYAIQNPSLVFAGHVFLDDDSSLYTQVSEHIVLTCQNMFTNRSEFGFFLRPCNLCVPSSVFEHLNGFNEEFRVSEDREFSERCLQAGIPLEQLESAIVSHRREFTLLSFWKAHFRYGQGAFHFHRWMANRQHSRIRLYHLKYYLEVFLSKPSFIPLLVVWQLANLAGFLTAWFQQDAK